MPKNKIPGAARTKATKLSTFQRGDDYIAKDSSHKSYGIHQNHPDHGNKIEVYGDGKLRDKILRFLQENP